MPQLKDDRETVERKIMSMYTDPTRLRATDPGHVEGNPVFAYHDAFNPDCAEVAELKDRYLKGAVGDVAVKRRLVEVMEQWVAPIRDRRRGFETRPDIVRDALATGSADARRVAQDTMEAVRAALRLDYTVAVS
jgi:Tryptophanyl-tRNA synthetase